MQDKIQRNPSECHYSDSIREAAPEEVGARTAHGVLDRIRQDAGDQHREQNTNCSMVQIIRIPPPDVDGDKDEHRCNDSNDRHGPDRDGVALQRVSEVRDHAFADEAVERLDGVEDAFHGDQKEQRNPVVGVRPRDPDAMRLHRGEGECARRSIGTRRRLHLSLSSVYVDLSNTPYPFQ